MDGDAFVRVRSALWALAGMLIMGMALIAALAFAATIVGLLASIGDVFWSHDAAIFSVWFAVAACVAVRNIGASAELMHNPTMRGLVIALLISVAIAASFPLYWLPNDFIL